MTHRSLALTVCLMAAAIATGQWSEPVTVAESLAPFGPGPELVSSRGDTIWVFWIHGPLLSDARLMACCRYGDTWRDPQVLASGQHGVYWPAAAVDDSGRMTTAFYAGSYPTARVEQDTWGIYLTALADTGWTRPEPIHVMEAAFPFEIELGPGRDGRLGMVWNENAGGMVGLDSVMFSRRTGSGWTPRRCLAPGLSPDVNCAGATLVPGETSDFTVAWCRSTPDSVQVEVWDADDSLICRTLAVSGSQPVLARSPEARFLVYCRDDSLFARVDRGSGWLAEQPVAAKLGRSRPGLCTDNVGWAWACWPDSAHRALMVSYNSGASWSRPETAATFTSLGNPAVASDQDGRIHCVWFDHAPGTEGRLRHAVRLTRPGIEAGEWREAKAARGTPTIVRRSLRMEDRGLRTEDRAELLDAAGRKVVKLHTGANDVSRLSPGVYFVREVQTQAQAQAVRKVIITR